MKECVHMYVCVCVCVWVGGGREIEGIPDDLLLTLLCSRADQFVLFVISGPGYLCR
jgi:hypothetical protein